MDHGRKYHIQGIFGYSRALSGHCTINKKGVPVVLLIPDTPHYLFNSNIYLYSCQLLISISSIDKVQNASIKALAKRAFVIKGTFRSVAARRIL